MAFLVITHVKHSIQNGNIYAYGPYVREMNLWFKHVDSVIVVAPLDKTLKPGAIDLAYTHPLIRFVAVPEFNFTGISASIKSLAVIPYILMVLWLQMWCSSHIHLRCPGNMGLLGCLVQVLFPLKKKTAKYAGNWDPASNQPLSYRIQKCVLRNTLITRNIQTLVYGEWPDRTDNILPFFTASYSEDDKIDIPVKTMKDAVIRFLFVGTLTPNKQPLLALQVFHALLVKSKRKMEMHFYGEGSERQTLTNYIATHELQHCVYLHGNVSSEVVKTAYIQSHFLLFFSKSEGWPKAVSEAMWWGCVPVTSPVSCVSWMVNSPHRGLVIEASAKDTISSYIASQILLPGWFTKASYGGKSWSRKYSLESFEEALQILL